MKATIAKLLPLILLTTSCGTGVFLTTGTSDDVYYSPSDRQVVVNKRIDAAVVPPAQVKQEAARKETDSIRVAQGDYSLIDSTRQEYVTNDIAQGRDEEYYYNPDDDYYYSGRINRFYRPSMGFGFYDPWFSTGFGYYDPFYYDFYSPFGYNPWYSNFYSPWGSYYGGYYGYGYSSWLWNDMYYNNWYGHDSWNNEKNYHYGPRHSMRTDGINGEGSVGMLKGGSPLYARGGAGSYSGASTGTGIKSGTTPMAPAPRSASDLKSESRPSGYRSSISSGQDPQARTSAPAAERTNSSSYIRSRTGNSYVQQPVQGSSSLRSSGLSGTDSRSSYVRPKSSTGASSPSSGSYRSSQSTGGSTYSGSSAPRSTYNSGSSGSSYRSSGSSSSSSYRSSGSSSYSGGSAVRSSSSGSSGSYSSGSSSSGRSMSSGSSGGGSSTRSSGGGGGGRR